MLVVYIAGFAVSKLIPIVFKTGLLSIYIADIDSYGVQLT